MPTYRLLKSRFNGVKKIIMTQEVKDKINDLYFRKKYSKGYISLFLNLTHNVVSDEIELSRHRLKSNVPCYLGSKKESYFFESELINGYICPDVNELSGWEKSQFESK